MDLITGEEKTQAIYNFLVGDDTPSCMIVIGQEGTGKTFALHAALKMLPKELDVNVQVWNAGELPQMIRFYDSMAWTKWIVFRHDDDEVARSIVKEWDSCGPISICRFGH